MQQYGRLIKRFVYKYNQNNGALADQMLKHPQSNHKKAQPSKQQYKWQQRNKNWQPWSSIVFRRVHNAPCWHIHLIEPFDLVLKLTTAPQHKGKSYCFLLDLKGLFCERSCRRRLASCRACLKIWWRSNKQATALGLPQNTQRCCPLWVRIRYFWWIRVFVCLQSNIEKSIWSRLKKTASKLADRTQVLNLRPLTISPQTQTLSFRYI